MAAKRRSKRRVQSSETGPGKKSPRIIPDPSDNDQHPLFSLTYMVRGYSVVDCDAEHKAAFADALWTRSRMTWNEITQTPRHGLGTEIIRRNSIKVAIPSTIPESAHFLSLRFHGTAPMIGFREGRVLHIVWLDHDYTVYSHS